MELWEIMLACTKLDAPMISTAMSFSPADLRDLVERGKAI